MSNAVRSKFTPLKPLKKQAGGDIGTLNAGLFLSKTISGNLVIEKRFTRHDVRDGHADREFRAMKQCNHRNIIQYIAVNLDACAAWGAVWMEYCSLGALDTLIDNFKMKQQMVPEAFVWRVVIDFAYGLCYMHTGIDMTSESGRDKPSPKDWNYLVHRDIKPGNVFMRRGEKGKYPTIVLGDFGCSILAHDLRKGIARRQVSRNAPAFAVPEGPYHEPRSDVYQMGLVIHCLCRKEQVPWEDVRQILRSPVGSYYSKELEHVVSKCLRQDVRSRVGSRELVDLVERYASRWLERGKKVPLPDWAFRMDLQDEVVRRR